MAACDDVWLERVSAWHDGAGSADEGLLVEAHLSSCDPCAVAAVRFGAVRRQLRAQARSTPAETLAALRISAALSPPRRLGARRPAAAGVLAAAVAAMIGLLVWPFGQSDALAAELERSHLKSFSRAKPCDFESADPAKVERWVSAEVGYAVEVPALPGATLLGARRCRVKGALTAALLYRKDGHALTLFVPPSGSPAADGAKSFGAGAARCTKGPHGERVCVAQAAAPILAVSDLEEPDLLGVLAAAAR